MMQTGASRQSFQNGRWLPHHELHVAIDDLGFTQGITAVERLRTYAGRAFQISRHLRRFDATITALEIAGLPDLQSQHELVEELLHRNRRWIDEQREAGIVVFATPGHSIRPALRPQRQDLDTSYPAAPGSPHPTFVAYLTPLPLAVIARRIRHGQPLVITNVMQPSAQTWPRHLKVRSRLHYFLADRQATAIDPDAVGVLLDEDQTVTETSIANLAVVRTGKILSPPAERVLPGVTQAVAEEIAAELKIDWEKRPLSIEETLDADELLLFGTTTGIWPGRLLTSASSRDQQGNVPASSEAIAGKAIAGPVFQSLRERFDALYLSRSSGYSP